MNPQKSYSNWSPLKGICIFAKKIDKKTEIET